jgi:hypothetical protein
MTKTKTPTPPVVDPNRRILTTYAYHPGDATPDLVLPTAIVGHYVIAPPRGPIRGDFSALEHSIAEVGVQSPVRIHTDGVFAVLTDGNSRHRLATKLDIVDMPVQVIPDNLRRMPLPYGRPVLEPELKEWVQGHLWAHDEHEVFRRQVGTPGMLKNAFLKCSCSCGARWKEEA